MSGSYSQEDVAKHNQYGDLWVIIDNSVYDLSKFADLHPAGRNVLKDYAGQDVTELFKQFHSDSILHKYHEKLCIGTLSDPKPNKVVPIRELAVNANKLFIGDGIPYGDPNWVQGWNNPYYNDSHRKLRIKAREFYQTEVAPFMDQWDMKKVLPKELFKKIADTGLIKFAMGKWQDKYFPEKKYMGIEIENPDYFHEMILTEETIKYGSIGLAWGIATSTIGLPPIFNHGTDFLQDKYVKQVLNGEKMIALAITEPWAGSDVANLQTTAVLSDDEKYYTVNGMKKFITTGEYADAFTVAVRTGGEGFFGVSLLVIDRNMPGVKTRKMNMGGVWGSGTAFIIFENVKVPAEQLVGDEGLGFMYIMQNFNHERFTLSCKCQAASRLVYEEAFKYAHLRKTFGKRLIDQPVIRQKLANMIKEIESLQAYNELIAYNMNKKDRRLEKTIASAIAIAKSQGVVIFEKMCSEAVQIVGGNGYQRGSVASKIERYYRETKSLTLGGGTPEIMFDMAIRQASKMYPKPKI
ncbi:Cytochrome b5-like heme/steroid binding domain [Pseudocohnilembus persalinus]|uniref:Cytochrome b5-like heme/steroid binding domain n=1 Tax=Pseudocohnilembus persalinus TaxID=266149 RepID=A0A0V0QMM4_PSEPJ|nr:Cytochrome b5-like heme/steroid binding domain [Pseudocohnilembus persalinus]|eukprot:KRX03469.1 Cytochrome b5-like heme/steroid binding domain [Pseudocohnilembus persalinus]